MTSQTRLKRPLVMVVDDSDVCAELAGIILEQAGAAVLTTSNGTTALSMATAWVFDLIYMDIQMPGMNGLETARRIRSTGGSNALLPIVALSASRLDGPPQRWADSGITACFLKPYRPAELLMNYRSWSRATDSLCSGQHQPDFLKGH